MLRRNSRAERAILNVAGPAAEEYYLQLGNFLNRLPNKDVMGMSLNHLKNIDEKEDPELAAKQNKVWSTQLSKCIKYYEQNKEREGQKYCNFSLNE